MKAYINIKKILVLVVVIFCLSLPMNASAAGDIKIEVNGSVIVPDAKPFITNGVTMVPLRFVSEPVGAVLDWDQASQTATLYRNELVVKVTMGNKIAYVNGEPMEMLMAASTVNDRTFVPLRFVAEGLGAAVNWISKTSTVTVDFAGMSRAMKVSAYYYDYRSLDVLQNNIDTLNDIIHFGYLLRADGTISEKDGYNNDKFNSEGQAFAQNQGKRTLMLVTGFDRDILNTVLADPQIRAVAINNIKNIITGKGLMGVDLDFESVSAERRADYPQFVRELKQALGEEHLVSISVTNRNNDRQTWKDGYDYAALAEAADQLLVMFYDQHYNGSSPGPIAGADWVEESIVYLLNYIPKEKFHAALGFYGRNWPVDGTGQSTSISNAFNLAAEKGAVIQRDEASGVPWFEYVSDDGTNRVVWFEDAQSLAQKAALAKKYNLAGIAVWRMDFITDDIWPSVINALK